MSKKKIGRWVAGLSVLAAVAVGSLAGVPRYEAQEIEWTAPASQTVAR